MTGVSGGTRKGMLVVEDEGLVAMLVEDAIAELGLITVGPVNRVAVALGLLENQNPQAALLDVNLAGETVYPVAAVLAERKIPFAFITGYGQAGLHSAYSDRPVLQKPFMPAQLQNVVRTLLEHVRAAPGP